MSESRAQIVGKVVQYDLSKLKPNPWNPNEMDAFTFDSLKQGFLTDGWLSSMALLVWGKDEKGVRRDLIIDGEQRWSAATQLGMQRGPCVFLDGVDEAHAKALTIKLDQKRGKFNKLKLSNLVADFARGPIELKDLGLELGFAPTALAALLKPHKIELPQPSRNVHTRQVPLYFSEEEAGEFHLLVQELSKKLKTETVTDTVLAALRALAKKADRGSK